MIHYYFVDILQRHASIEFCFHIDNPGIFEQFKEVYDFAKCQWKKFKENGNSGSELFIIAVEML